VLTVWECELKDRSALELRLDAFLRDSTRELPTDEPS
jgi:DNA mismatch endonuclease, patch repair protein